MFERDVVRLSVNFSLRRKVLSIFLWMGLFFPINISAYEISFRLNENATFPFLSGGNYYSVIGENLFFDTGINVNKFTNLGLAVGTFIMPKAHPDQLEEGVSPVVIFVPVGFRADFFWYPGSRLEVGGGLAFGASLISSGDIPPFYAPWYNVYGDVLFRVNPNFSLGLNLSWIDIQSYTWWGNPAMAGGSVGVTAKLKIETEKLLHNVKASVEQYERVFPLLASLYRDNPIGEITIQNNESAEIRNVKVYFRSPDYTASDTLCGEIKKIYKNETVQIPLVADFSNRIMQFSESGDIPCEIIIEYELLRKKRRTVESVILSVYNRNQMRWMDPSMLSAYISTNSQQVLQLAKNLVGVARNQLRSGLNRNLQFAMYLFEGIRLNGIECKPDNSTPYEIYHQDDSLLDYLQYPFQTLIYKSGDVDDIGLLFMAMLESANIEAGYIPLSDDFIVLIDLKTSESKVGSMMDGTDRVIILDDNVWLPISMSTLREGFINSWYHAVTRLIEGAENDEDETYYLLSESWQVYPPVSFSSGNMSPDIPLESLLVSAVETDMARYITTEFGPQIAAVQYQIKENGASVELLNKLGLLYVRAGIYSSAIPVYERSAAMGSVSAMNNLGNIAILQRRYDDARMWYERALSVNPKNSAARSGLERALGQLEE